MFFAINPITNPVVDFLKGKDPQESPEIFGNLLSAIVGFLLSLATIWTFVQLIRGGFQWITAGGDKGKLEEAQQRILNGIVGLFILFSSWAVFLIILNFFGITGEGDGIQLILPKL